MSVTKIAAPNQRNPLNIGMSLRKASLPQDPTLHYSTIPPPRFLSSNRACLPHAEGEHKHAEDTGHAHRGRTHGGAAPSSADKTPIKRPPRSNSTWVI